MRYSGVHLNEISFPLGGIGTGSIGLSGNGCLVDWEIFNRPNKGSHNPYSHFAVKAEYPDGKAIVKILQGDWEKSLTGQYSKANFSGFGFGPFGHTMCAFPHFRNVTFDGRFPVAELTFTDEDFPGEVVLTAFNPFIPLDADNSSIPAAFFDIQIRSQLPGIRYSVIFTVSNPFDRSLNRRVESSKYTAVTLSYAGKTPSDKEFGELTVATDAPNGLCQEYWYRGGWQDGIATFWYDLNAGQLQNRSYDTPGGKDPCSIGGSAVAGENTPLHFRFALSWNIPNNYNYWSPYQDENGNDILWKNYYAVLFENSEKSCFYALDNWDMLYGKTRLFRDALHGSTLDSAVIDAAASTLSVLKSPTVLRLEDGTFYGWEGVHEDHGSCEGTCTHVWSYAYALCFLFPELERSLRNTELKNDTDETGRMQFRTTLPLGRARNSWRACLDGQMATLMKAYRDWKITGNSHWLRENWADLKKVLEYAWNPANEDEWDRDHDGILEGRQHHTLDMELFGPSSWLQSMYLGALKAAAEMAAFLGDTEKQAEYTALFESGYAYTRDNLFNGSYFIQKVDLKDEAIIDHFDARNYWNEEKKELKYQIADGCEIDQMLGQWHANIIGLGDLFDREQRLTALNSMVKNNFKASMRNFPNAWRVFVLNDEGGAVMCDYPEGTHKPVLPIPYTEECMTGFEYAFAGLLISEGLIEEGLTVVRAIRDRYDGAKRNPWNEIECGSNYARPMASFALLPIFSGFTFDLPRKHIGFHPIVEGDFNCFWSLGTGWGTVARTEKGYRVDILSGSLALDSISLGGIQVQKVTADGVEVPFTQEGENIRLSVSAERELRFEVAC